MKALLLTAICCLVFAASFSQNVAGVDTRRLGSGMFLRSYFSTPFETKNKYSGIEGSPFVDDNWVLARLYIDSVQYFDSIKIRINAFENEVHYLDENDEEFQATSTFREILIIDKDSKSYGTVFRSGLYEDPNIYFQVLADGKKVQLLLKTKIEKWVTKAMFEESKTIFQQEKEIFFSVHNNLIKQNKSCTVLNEITGNDGDVLKFINDNMLKCNKEADMKRLAEFINSH
jgi:hypothetical protein